MKVENATRASACRRPFQQAPRTVRGMAVCMRLSLACALAAACVGAWGLPASAAAAASAASASAGRSGDALRLIEAVRHGHVDIVGQQVGSGLAVDACAQEDGTALIVAARRGDRADTSME